MKRLIALVALCILCLTSLVSAQGVVQDSTAGSLQQTSGSSVQGNSNNLQNVGASNQGSQSLEQLTRSNSQAIPLPNNVVPTNEKSSADEGIGFWDKVLVICLVLGVFVALMIVWGVKDAKEEKIKQEKAAKAEKTAKATRKKKATKTKTKSKKKKKAHR